MKKIRKEIKNFLLTNPQLRKLNLFFSQFLKPLFIKLLIFSAILIFVIIIALKIFKPSLLEKAYYQARYSFFYYLKFDKVDLNKISITGNKRSSEENIIKIIQQLTKKNSSKKAENYQPLIQNLIDEIRASEPWINKIIINRNIDGAININITEYEPFAIWYNDGNKYMIDKDGNAIIFKNEKLDSEEFKNMIIISGDNANNNIRSLFNIIATNPEISDNIYSANWIGNRRWDILFFNGLLVKMPEIDISEAWHQFTKIYKNENSENIKSIDLRIKNKIYIEYKNNTENSQINNTISHF